MLEKLFTVSFLTALLTSGVRMAVRICRQNTEDRRVTITANPLHRMMLCVTNFRILA